jgi:tRNA(adenine34) deaminase
MTLVLPSFPDEPQGEPSGPRRDVATADLTEASQGAVEASQGAVEASQGAVEASQGTVEASQGAVEASQGAIEASQGRSVASPEGADAQGEASADGAFMREALEEARLAADAGDVPVGAVVVVNGEVIARGRNRRELDHDPTAHAEIDALRAASRARKSWRLGDATLYVTLEPCPMCAGALVNARIHTVVYGCTDPKAGAVDTLFTIGRDARLNHRFAVRAGVLREPCADLLRAFFAARRKPKG